MERPAATALLLGLWMLGAAGALHLARLDAEAAPQPALVRLLVLDPHDRRLINDTVELSAGHNTVLAALQASSLEHRFEVRLQKFPGLGVMVVQIFEFRNEGPCGWVYEVNEKSGDRAAGAYFLASGDVVRWSWSCPAG